MSTLQLTNESHHVLEVLLRKNIAECRILAGKFPTLAAKVNKEADEYEAILNQLLRTPLLSDPRPDPQPKKDNVLPHYARPKFRIAP